MVVIALCAHPRPAASAEPDASSSTRAAIAFRDFLATFWNPATASFYARSDHSPWGTDTRATFWWSAELWETVLDAYESNVPGADRALVDRVYDGFMARYPTFRSAFNDDRGWWALASIRAFELTRERRYLLRAEQLSDQMWRSWDDRLGGGLWWRSDLRDQKNVATNAPAAITAARIYEATREQRFLDRGKALYGWLDGNLRNGDRLDDHVTRGGALDQSSFTYNEGTFFGAATELYRATGDFGYLSRAEAVADAELTGTRDGVLPSEGRGDGGGFKGIFVEDLARLAGTSGPPRYRAFILRNASAAWANRRADGMWGAAWSAQAGSGAIDSLTDSSAVRLLLLAIPRPTSDEAHGRTASRSDRPAADAVSAASDRRGPNRPSTVPIAAAVLPVATSAAPDEGRGNLVPLAALGMVLAASLGATVGRRRGRGRRRRRRG